MRFDKSAIETLAQELLAKHGLTEWRLEWDTAKRRLGCCKYNVKLITLSLPNAQLNPQEVAVETLKHEIAHALTPKDRGHGQAWKLMALVVGARPKRCAGPEVKIVKGKLKAICGLCKKEHFMHRPTTKKYYCRCYRQKINAKPQGHALVFRPHDEINETVPSAIIDWRLTNGQTSQTSPVTQLSLF